MSREQQRTELYMIRHVETVMNKNSHIVGGRSNHTPPTERGVEQGGLLGQILDFKGLRPDRVYCSPALRTLNTAKLSLAAMNLLHEKIIIEHDIQELSQGPWEGLLRSEVYNEAELERVLEMGKAHKLGDGAESFDDVSSRMLGWMNRTFREDEPGRYFAYTHGNAIKSVLGELMGWDRDKTFTTLIRNTSLAKFVLEDGVWKPEFWNKLPEEIKKENGPSRNELAAAIRASYGRDTSLAGDRYSPENPELGQCVPASVVVQDYEGGDIVRARVIGADIDETHYYNELEDGPLDLTRSQYRQPIVMGVQPLDLKAKGLHSVREYALASQETRRRYLNLRTRVDRVLAQRALG